MPNLTPREGDVAEAIKRYVAQHNRMPSYKFLEGYLVMHRSSVERILNRLEDKGVIERFPQGTILARLVDAVAA